MCVFPSICFRSQAPPTLCVLKSATHTHRVTAWNLRCHSNTPLDFCHHPSSLRSAPPLLLHSNCLQATSSSRPLLSLSLSLIVGAKVDYENCERGNKSEDGWRRGKWEEEDKNSGKTKMQDRGRKAKMKERIGRVKRQKDKHARKGRMKEGKEEGEKRERRDRRKKLKR